MGDDVSTITFEQLYNMVRAEKINEDLQKLHPETYAQLINYLKTKMQMFKQAKGTVQPAELEKIKNQIVSARKLIKELYERRERKILQLAINKSRTRSEAITGEDLLKEEQLMFNQSTDMLNKYRKGILLNLVNSKMPFSDGDEPEEPKHKDVTKQEVEEEPKIEEKQEVEEKEEPKQIVEQEKTPDEATTTNIQFLTNVPAFLGTELETYGPFEPGETIELPSELAAVLIKREAAKEI